MRTDSTGISGDNELVVLDLFLRPDWFRSVRPLRSPFHCRNDRHVTVAATALQR